MLKSAIHHRNTSAEPDEPAAQQLAQATRKLLDTTRHGMLAYAAVRAIRQVTSGPAASKKPFEAIERLRGGDPHQFHAALVAKAGGWRGDKSREPSESRNPVGPWPNFS